MNRNSEALRSSGGFHERGSALLVVLLLLATIAALAVVLGRSISGAALEMRASRQTEQNESDVRAGIDLGVGAILKLGETMRSADVSARLGERRIDVRVTNERGRIDLNVADREVLAALLQAAGAVESEAAEMVRGLIEWRGGSASQRLAAPSDGNRPFSGTFGRADPRPDAEFRKAPGQIVGTRFFFHPLQLVSVPGFSRQVIARILPLVTVANGANRIDPYIAPQAVLEALPDVSAATVEAFVAARDGNVSREAAIKLLGLADELVTADAAPGWRLQIRTLGSGGRVQRSEAVIAVVEDDSRPYRVLYVLDDQLVPRADGS